jgi:hypothetical protein
MANLPKVTKLTAAARFKALLVGALISPGLHVYASIIGLELYPDSRFSILR